MKEIIKTAIKNYVLALITMMLVIATIFAVQFNAVGLLLVKAFEVWIVTEIIYYIKSKIVNFLKLKNNK